MFLLVIGKIPHSKNLKVVKYRILDIEKLVKYRILMFFFVSLQQINSSL